MIESEKSKEKRFLDWFYEESVYREMTEQEKELSRLLTVTNIEKAIESISYLHEWATAYPMKTYKDDFFEKFPDALRDYEGYPKVIRGFVYGNMQDNEIMYRKGFLTAWDAPLGTWEDQF